MYLIGNRMSFLGIGQDVDILEHLNYTYYKTQIHMTLFILDCIDKHIITSAGKAAQRGGFFLWKK